MGKIIKDGVEYDFGSDIIYHLISSGDSGGSSEGDSESNSGIKVVELGALGETFDLTQYEGYGNFTLDNFYVQVDSASSKAGTTGINYWTDSRGRTAYIAKSEITGGSASLSELLSYDASTGQLTTKKTGSGSVTMQATSNQDSYDKKSAYASLSLTVEGTVYLIQASESDGSGESSGGIGGNANTVLLWSQPANGDGTKFNTQTLSLPEIANYEGVAIKCCLCNNSGNGYVNEVMTYYFEKGTSMRVGMRKSSDDVSMATVYRVIEVTEDSVIFNDAYATSTADGRYIYPMEIYGYTTEEVTTIDNSVKFTKSVTVGSSNITSLSIDISEDYPDYQNITIDDIAIQHNGQLVADGGDLAASGIPKLSYSYDSSTGVITAKTTTNTVFTSVVFYRGHTHDFDIAIVNSSTIVGDTGSGDVVEEEKVLLWENTKPTSSFAAQTVTLSQSVEEFDWLEILVYQSTTLQTKPAVYRYQVEQLMDETFHMNYPNKDSFGFVNRGESNGTAYSRQFGFISSTEMYISESLQRNPIKVSATTAEMIPYQIYGVKNGVVANNIYPIFENGWQNGASLNSSSKCTVGENIVLTTTSSATEANFTANIPDIENLLGICVEFSQTGGNTSFTLNMGQNTGASMPKGDNYTIFCKYVSGSVFSLNASCGATNTITINKIYAILDGGVINEETSITRVNYGDFESFAKFVNNCDTTMGGLVVYIDDFSKVKSFTYEVTATNYSSYIRYKNDSGTITNIFGDNYTEHGISAGKSATITKTVNCEELNFDVGYPVFWALGSSTNITNLKITSYEMVDGYTYPEAGGIGDNTTPTVQLPSGVTLTSNAAYRGNTSCSTYFIKGIEQAIFSTSCVNEEEEYKGQPASATSTITIKNASGTAIHTQNITTNTNTTFTFDWDAYGCDIIFVTLSIADAQVTYYTSSVSIATV